MNKIQTHLKYLLLLLFITVLNGDELKLGVNFLQMDYVESGTSGEFLDSETSQYNDIGGFNISYKKDFKTDAKSGNINSLEVSFRKFSGNSNYDGFLQNSKGAIVSKYQTTTQNSIVEPKIRLIQTKYTASYDVGVFVSFANRNWTRDITSTAYGYKEIYDWKYVDVGMKTLFYDGSWEVGLEFAYQKAIEPTMTAYLNGVTKFDLNDVKGYYYKIPLGYNFNKNFKVELEYEYNQWDIGASNVVNNFYEPNSITKNKMLNITFSYKF